MAPGDQDWEGVLRRSIPWVEQCELQLQCSTEVPCYKWSLGERQVTGVLDITGLRIECNYFLPVLSHNAQFVC